MKKSVKKKKKFQKLKKNLSGFLALVLVVALTIVGTLAYLSTQTTPVTNTFTASANISLGIEEPNYYYEITLDENGKLKPRTFTGTTPGPDPAKYIPGTVYAKDPTLYNLTGDGDSSKNPDPGTYEWVAMKVNYQMSTPGDPDTIQYYTRQKLEYSDTEKQGIIKAIKFDVTNTTLEVTNGNWIKVSSSMFNGENDFTSTDITDSALLTEVNKLKNDIKAVENKANINDSNITGEGYYEVYIYKYPVIANTITSVSGAIVDTGNASKKDTPTFKTTPLFNQIEIMDQDTLTDTDKGNYTIDNLPQFQIITKGGAIKKTEEFAIDEFEDNGGISVKTGKKSMSTQYYIIKALWEVLAKEESTT